ncbi:MAG: hypothetical protein RBR07_04835 [Arcobacteraceae bacterium]|jgi:hypothetical protein|nr:hypothetical protein [Arcobacteraceae bacterium]
MPHYQVTVKQGRSDTLTLETNSVNDIKDLFNQLSTATITSIKEIVYSKDLNINYTQKTYIQDNYNNICQLIAQSETKAKQLTIYNVKKDITPQQIEQSLIKNKIYIDDEQITKLTNCLLSTLRA